MIEALLAIASLSLLALATTVVYGTGLNSLHARSDELRLQSALRSEMEEAVSMTVGDLADQTRLLDIGGYVYTCQWSIATVDLDGDSVPETNAVQITISAADRSLDLLRVDHNGRLGKH